MNRFFYPRLAARSLKNNSRFYLPYMLTVIGTAAAFYILAALAMAPDLPEKTRYDYLQSFMVIGLFVVGFFSVIFLFYTNSFLMKRRKKELGLYNILGMGKRNIAVMLAWECFYTAIIGIGGGILLGMLLQKLVTMLLCKLMNYNTSFGFYVSFRAIALSFMLYGGILFLNLLFNLRRIHVQKPAELLYAGNAGEKEPKARFLVTVLGLLCLGEGYYLAIKTSTAMEAISVYFIAVFLVIIGTYCLFTGISIMILKMLRRNKRFYYKTRHFIGVSGMLYRMKRNAAGLANICILSTMVLVMVSGTLTLYLGTEDAINTIVPADYNVEVKYTPGENEFREDTVMNDLKKAIEEKGLRITGKSSYRYLAFSSSESGFDFSTNPDNYTDAVSDSDIICFLSAGDYMTLTGKDVKLSKDEAIYGGPGKLQGEMLRISFKNSADGAFLKTLSYKIKASDTDFPGIGNFYGYFKKVHYIVVSDYEELKGVYAAQSEAQGESASSICWNALINVSGTEEEKKDCYYTLSTYDFLGKDLGDWERLDIKSNIVEKEDMYSLNGGFFSSAFSSD